MQLFKYFPALHIYIYKKLFLLSPIESFDEVILNYFEKKLFRQILQEFICIFYGILMRTKKFAKGKKRFAEGKKIFAEGKKILTEVGTE